MTKTASKLKHIHRLRRHTYKTGAEIFFCTLPDCHFKIDAALSIGKESLCNVCGNPFILTIANSRQKMPHCHRCGKVRVTVDGKTRYINKSFTPNVVVAKEMASDNISDLRAKLDSIVNPEPDEDI